MPAIKWNATLYDNKHSFVAKYGEDVIGWLAPQEGERILDVGCGTGILTEKLAESGAKVTGIDASAEMIAKAKEAYPNIRFFVKDATNFSFDEPFDAVFSNATLHWINEQEKALQCIHNCLKPGGRFVFEMGGKHNIESIHDAVRKVLTEEGFEEKAKVQSNFFPSVAEQSALLEKIGFTIRSIANFERPTKFEGEDGMRNWIVQFCGFFFKNVPEEQKGKMINKAVEYLRPTNYKDGIWYGDYVRLRVSCLNGDL
ncbi:MAG: class I SAM-dependent methyltransferase [Ilyomonas sp.]